MSILLKRHGVFAAHRSPSEAQPVFFEEKFNWGTGLLIDQNDWGLMFARGPNIQVSEVEKILRAHSDTDNARARALCLVDLGSDQFVEVHVGNLTRGRYVMAHLRLGPLLSDGTRDGYEFRVQEQGTWQIHKREGSPRVIRSGSFDVTDSLILRGEAIGDTLRIFINGVQVGAVNDTTFTEGLSGLTVRSRAPLAVGAHVTRFICGTL